MDSKEFAAQFKEIFELAMLFSKTVRTEGLFALKPNKNVMDTEKANKKNIFHYGLRLAVNRTDHQTINDTLTNIINQETDKDVKTLKTIQKEAVLAIQSGMNPRIIAILLNSYVDNETAGVIDEKNCIIDYDDGFSFVVSGNSLLHLSSFNLAGFDLGDEPFELPPEGVSDVGIDLPKTLLILDEPSSISELKNNIKPDKNKGTKVWKY